MDGLTDIQRAHSIETRVQIETRREQRTQYLQDREKRRAILESYLSRSTLTDAEKSALRDQLNTKETAFMRLFRQPVGPKDFQTVKVIGRGGFGEVHLVVKNGSMEPYAMKIMRKNEMVLRRQIEHLRAEREVLAQTHFTNEWVVRLFYSFQDDVNLYLVMEYLGGGDLMFLLCERGVFPEAMARFYIGELLLAIDSIHRLNYIHRDIKPDNILIDYSGHIKLTDFGLCTGFHQHDCSDTFARLVAEKKPGRPSLTHRRGFSHNYKTTPRAVAYSVVGTPDYTAPEVFSRKGYTKAVDYWSAGVILFEMVAGGTPFYDDDQAVTCARIIQSPNDYAFPDDLDFTPEVVDLIHRLVCDEDRRYTSLESVRNHPFMRGFDFVFVNRNTPPFIPKLRTGFDTSRFDNPEEDLLNAAALNGADQTKKNAGFAGYTFKGFLNVCNDRVASNAQGVTLESIFTSHEAEL